MSGAVILVRHGEPALSRKVRLTAAGYRDWWARYELGGLKPGQTPPEPLGAMATTAKEVLSSTRERAIQSARAVVRGGPFASEDQFIEAPLPSPPAPDWMKLSPRWWGVVSRLWWRAFNYHDGQESHARAKVRAGVAADALIARASGGETVMLIAHGYFNFMIGSALEARGWRRTLNQGFRYWSARRYESAQLTLRRSSTVG